MKYTRADWIWALAYWTLILGVTGYTLYCWVVKMISYW